MGERVDVEQERKDRAESLHLTLLAAPAEVDGFDLLRLAYWVHTGQEPPNSVGTVAVSADAATWHSTDATA